MSVLNVTNLDPLFKFFRFPLKQVFIIPLQIITSIPTMIRTYFEKRKVHTEPEDVALELRYITRLVNCVF